MTAGISFVAGPYGGEPEIPPGSPPEVPPGQPPEVPAEPVPEPEPPSPPELPPDTTPEIPSEPPPESRRSDISTGTPFASRVRLRAVSSAHAATSQ
jgi:hypothetical protein